MTPELRSGLLAGVLLAMALGVMLVLNGDRLDHENVRRVRAPVGVAGLAIVVGTLVTLAGRQPVPGELLVAVGGIGIIGAFDPRRLGAPASVALALPLAWLMSSDLDLDSASSGFGWIRAFVVLVTAASTVAVTRTEETWASSAITPLLLAITAAGVFLAVPDTEEAGALLGVAVAIAVLGWPLGLATLGRAGAGAVTVLVVWTAATGGRAAPASIVAAVACLGLLVGLGVGRAMADARLADARLHGARNLQTVHSRVAVVVGHGALVLFAARVGGAGAGMGVAVVVAFATLLVGVVAGAVLRPVSP